MDSTFLDIVEAPTKSEACQAAAIGAAGLYHAACHLCAFDSMQNPDQNHDATKALFRHKSSPCRPIASRKGQTTRAPVPNSNTSSKAEVGTKRRTFYTASDAMRKTLRTYSVDTLCDMIISWSERIMATYAESPQALIVREERETDREQV